MPTTPKTKIEHIRTERGTSSYRVTVDRDAETVIVSWENGERVIWCTGNASRGCVHSQAIQRILDGESAEWPDVEDAKQRVVVRRETRKAERENGETPAARAARRRDEMPESESGVTIPATPAGARRVWLCTYRSGGEIATEVVALSVRSAQGYRDASYDVVPMLLVADDDSNRRT